MHYLSRVAIVCALFLAVSTPNGYAATITYTGGGPNDLWSTGANWNSGSPPSSQDLARIFGGAQPLEVSQSGAVARYVDIRNNGVLNVTGGDLTFGFSSGRWLWVGFQSPGTLNQSGGLIQGVGANVDMVVDTFGTYNMTGGILDLSDDLHLRDGSQVSVSGSSSMQIGDDLILLNNRTSTLNINLIGDQEPIISVGDDLFLLGDLDVFIDTSLWTGGSTYDIFQVGDRFQGQLNSVTIDGIAQDPNNVQFIDGSVVIPLNEPRGGVLAGIALICVVIPLRRQHLSNVSEADNA